VTITATSEGITGTAPIGVRQPLVLPTAPQDVRVSVGPTYVELDITWSGVPGASLYHLYWGTTPGVTPQTGTQVELGAPAFRHQNLTAHTTYYYVVTAVNGAGEGPPSTEAHATASGDIAITTLAPEVGGLSDTLLGVEVNPVARFQIGSVTASVAGRTTNLAFVADTQLPTGTNGPVWAGTILLVGLPRGAQQLSITVVDAFADTALQFISFLYDQPPRLVVTAPDDFSVARPDIRVTATCTDDDPKGCTSITIEPCNGFDCMPPVATGQGGIDQTVSLGACDGCSLELVYAATDSAGQRTVARRRVFVESSAQLTEVTTVKGRILDVRADRILYLDQSSGQHILAIHDRASGNDVVIFNMPGAFTEDGSAFLTPTGALFVADTGQTVLTNVLYDWESGSLTSFGMLNSATSLVVKDSFALWSASNPPCCFTQTLVRRDLFAGVNIAATDSAGNNSNDVANNGDVVYWSTNGYQIYRVRNGITTRLAFDTTLWDTYPTTDGINVAYTKSIPCCVNVEYQVALYDSVEHVLTPLDPTQPTYRTVNRWVAYTKTGSSGETQIWARSPAGLETQATQFGTSSRLEALGPNGEVILVNTFGGVTRRYLAMPDFSTQPRDIGSGLGTPFFLNGALFVRIGRTLYQVSP
jgi:hypothetical protein